MSKYPLILALHEADQEASTLLEGEKDNKVLTKEQADAGEKPWGGDGGSGRDFQEAEAIGGAED